jgi:hypothetical protein
MKKNYELLLQNYLANNNGHNLSKIEENLKIIEKEHIFPGGRIDILAEKNKIPVAIELKIKDYNTRGICAQLLNYLNYMSSMNGKVYFVAPTIKYGVFSTLKNYYSENKLKFFEVSGRRGEFFFEEKKPNDLSIKNYGQKIIPYSDDDVNKALNKEIFYTSIALLIPNKKAVNLIYSILDDGKSESKQLEDIANNTISLFVKNRNIKKTYNVIKLLNEYVKRENM